MSDDDYDDRMITVNGDDLMTVILNWGQKNPPKDVCQAYIRVGNAVLRWSRTVERRTP